MMRSTETSEVSEDLRGLVAQIERVAMSSNGFEPRIVGFLCNWCSYQGADMAGTARSNTPRTSTSSA